MTFRYFSPEDKDLKIARVAFESDFKLKLEQKEAEKDQETDKNNQRVRAAAPNHNAFDTIFTDLLA